jgi:UDP-N-acetylglucosamine 2-epimerase (non-hydrolysing)
MTGRRKVLSVVGTRPNFMKIAPIASALAKRPDEFEHVLVHTGQHYDSDMSEIFLDELGVEEPDYRLGVGSGTHAQQSARVMERLEPVLLNQRPDFVLVPGDVNSTLAASLVAAKLGFAVGHVEAGLRSFDRTMPEEINRIVADAVSDLLFIHSPEAREHLLTEGRREEQIHYVGNTMIDTLVAVRGRLRERAAASRFGVSDRDYLVVTLHRPALVDTDLLHTALEALETLSRDVAIVFPMHPRTRARVRDAGLPLEDSGALKLIEPIGYLDFLALVATSAGVVTDSGGIQEETTFLGVPCLTLRDNTERPITESMGTNSVIGLRPEQIVEAPELLARIRSRKHRVPPLWDGHAAERIVEVLMQS